MRSTSIEVIDEELWAWAKYRAWQLGFRNKRSEYLFELIKKDRNGEIKWEKRRSEEKRT